MKIAFAAVLACSLCLSSACVLEESPELETESFVGNCDPQEPLYHSLASVLWTARRALGYDEVSCYELAIAGSVAWAESGFNRYACNENWEDNYDRGIWQINSANFQNQGIPECATSDEPHGLYGLVCNAEYMAYVRNLLGWGAWATYNEGIHQRYFAEVSAEVSRIDAEYTYADFCR